MNLLKIGMLLLFFCLVACDTQNSTPKAILGNNSPVHPSYILTKFIDTANNLNYQAIEYFITIKDSENSIFWIEVTKEEYHSFTIGQRYDTTPLENKQ